MAKHWVNFAGKTLSIAEQARRFGQSPSTVHSRLEREWDLAEAIHEQPDRVMRVAVRGEIRTISEWAEAMGISEETIRSRLRRGWPPALSVTAPLGHEYYPRVGKTKYEYDGREMTLSEWAAAVPFDIDVRQLWRRIEEYGWPVERAFTTPPRKYRRRK